MLAHGLAVLVLLAGGPTLAAPPQTVAPDPGAVEVARWQGWGASLSWWAVYSEHWPARARREVCRRLFGRADDCLGLTVARYNAGGTAPDADRKPFRAGADVLAALDPDGSWHPDRDAAQMECLRLARRFGADTFELFANSPPWWMLRNRNTRGGDGGRENLLPEREKDYADWLAATARRVEDACSVRFSTLEPFNEPSAWWWDGAKSGQEGCYVSWPAQARILQHLTEAVARSGRRWKVACSDENDARSGYNTLDWLTKPDDGKGGGGGLSGSAIGQLNVHSYSGWEWQERLRDLAAARGTGPVCMSEVSHREWENAGFVPNDMRCALPLSRSVVSDIRRLRCSAWVIWQPVEPLQYALWYHYTYGLLPAAVDGDVAWNGRTWRPGEFVVAKSFYALQQFSRFIRPGARILRSGDEWTLAALSPDGRRLVLVVHNDTAQPKPYAFDLRHFGAAGRTVRAWRTKDDDPQGAWNCRRLPDLRLVDRGFADTAPARSVTTFVVAVSRAPEGPRVQGPPASRVATGRAGAASRRAR